MKFEKIATNKLLLSLTIIIQLVLINWLLFKNSEPEILFIKGKTELLSMPEIKELVSENRVISILEKGTYVKVLTRIYPKFFMFYKVRLENGLEGYIMFDSQLIEEVNFPTNPAYRNVRY